MFVADITHDRALHTRNLLASLPHEIDAIKIYRHYERAFTATLTPLKLEYNLEDFIDLYVNQMLHRDDANSTGVFFGDAAA